MTVRLRAICGRSSSGLLTSAARKCRPLLPSADLFQRKNGAMPGEAANHSDTTYRLLVVLVFYFWTIMPISRLPPSPCSGLSSDCGGCIGGELPHRAGAVPGTTNPRLHGHVGSSNRSRRSARLGNTRTG